MSYPSLHTVYNKLPGITGKADLITQSQTTRDIINAVINQHAINVKQAQKIAHLFDAGSVYDTCQRIWNFLKYEIPYTVEPANKQTAKTLARIVHDAAKGTGKNDCKHYSNTAGAILACLNIPFIYRFAGYSNYSNMPTHVYIVAMPGKNEIIIDAVLNDFNTEKPYKIKIDKKPKNMALYKLSGVNEPAEMGNILKKLKKAAKGVASSVAKVAKTVKEKAFTVSFAVPRNAFLLLLRFNVHGWATGLSKMDFNRLAWWRDWFGGNRTDLMNAIKEGAKRKRILGIQDDDILYEKNAVGVEPTTTAAALASATPIIVKVTNLLKEAEKISNTAEGITSTIDKTTNAVNSAKERFKNITGRDVTDLIYTKGENEKTSKNTLTSADLQRPTDEQAMKVAQATLAPGKTKINTSTMLLIGGGLVAGVLLLSKRK